MSKTIHIITEGEYSDYHVTCACPSKEAAEKLAKRLNGDEKYENWQVEEIVMADADCEKVSVLRMWALIESRDGSVTHESNTIVEKWPFECDGGPAAVAWEWRDADGMSRGYLDVWGTNHQLVQKIYGEQRMMLVAEPARRAQSYKGRIEKTERGK